MIWNVREVTVQKNQGYPTAANLQYQEYKMLNRIGVNLNRKRWVKTHRY
jgi:hypothetical protein